jgi:hypothetical protein
MPHGIESPGDAEQTCIHRGRHDRLFLPGPWSDGRQPVHQAHCAVCGRRQYRRRRPPADGWTFGEVEAYGDRGKQAGRGRGRRHRGGGQGGAGWDHALVPTVSHAVNPALQPRLPYDSKGDFVAVARVATVPLVLSVASSFPAATLAVDVGPTISAMFDRSQPNT